MTLTFDVVTDPHPLLDQAVLDLNDEDKLEALNSAAERLLGLFGRELSPDDVYTASTAVVYQMNYMISMGTAGFSVQSERRGQRQVVYKGTRATGVPPIALLARQALRSLSTDGWSAGLVGLRTG